MHFWGSIQRLLFFKTATDNVGSYTVSSVRDLLLQQVERLPLTGTLVRYIPLHLVAPFQITAGFGNVASLVAWVAAVQAAVEQEQQDCGGAGAGYA